MDISAVADWILDIRVIYPLKMKTNPKKAPGSFVMEDKNPGADLVFGVYCAVELSLKARAVLQVPRVPLLVHARTVQL